MTPLELQITLDECQRLADDLVERIEFQEPALKTVPLKVEARAINARSSLLVEHKDEMWNIILSDGSQVMVEHNDKRIPRAAWATVIPTTARGADQFQTTSNWVDGIQTNQRAELLGLLAAHMSVATALQDGSRNPPTRVLLATDSQEGISQIERFTSLTTAKQLRTRHRDILREICQLRETIAKHDCPIEMIHIYSHQDDEFNGQEPHLLPCRIDGCNQPRNHLHAHPKAPPKTREDRVADERMRYTPETYKTMIAGNKAADKLASKLSKGTTGDENIQKALKNPNRPKQRNARKQPTPEMDEYYITDKNKQWVDDSVYQVFRNHYRQRHVESIMAKKQSKRYQTMRILLEEDKVSQKLSNVFHKSRGYDQQKASEKIMALRSHSILTQKKLHDRGTWKCFDTPWRNYYSTMYKENCHHCKAVVEDTPHIMECTGCSEAEQIKIEVWETIRKTIAEARKVEKIGLLALYPFACSAMINRTHSADHIQLFSNTINRNKTPGLLELLEFDRGWGNYGYIPAALPKALRELGVETSNVEKVATEIAGVIHLGISKVIEVRNQVRAKALRQRAQFRKHVLGIDITVAAENDHQ